MQNLQHPEPLLVQLRICQPHDCVAESTAVCLRADTGYTDTHSILQDCRLGERVLYVFFFRLDLKLTRKSTAATMYLFLISWAEVYAAA